MTYRKLLSPITTVVFLLILSSCANVEKTVYFANEQNAAVVSNTPVPETLIQPNDILSISVSSMNPTATVIFNMPNTSYVTASSATGGTIQSPGYLVNPTGYITFPVIGDIKVSGMTTNQVRAMLSKELVDRKLLVDPIVMVRQLNFKVSVIGEVAHPTVVNVPSEKISLLEALGMAGDITIYGRKDNVMVIREENGTKKITRLNLNSNELFTSQYYYLKSNDIVYVEANKAKATSSSQTMQVLPVVLSALSFLAIILTNVSFKK